MTAVTIDSFNYLLSETDATITGYAFQPSNWNLVIPSTISYLGNAYNVVSIGSGSFKGYTSLTSVTISSFVTSIGDEAFAYCTSLTSVTIPSSVTSIGAASFQSCTSLASLNFSSQSSLISIGAGSFQSCTSLTSLIIPSSVTTIYSNAFTYCTSLINITINSYLSNLSSVFVGINNANMSFNFNYSGDIPDSVCNGKTNLKTLTIGSGITSIGASAFRNCTSLTSVSISNTVTIIKNNAFRSCTSLTSLTIPFSVKIIEFNAFRSCTGLKSATFSSPSSLTTIGQQAFQSCTSLTSVTIPNTIESIGALLFLDCSSSIVVNYNPTINDLPSGVTWYDFNIKLNSNNSIILDGYFSVINNTNFVKLMYSKKKLYTNILAQYTNNDYGNDHSWDSINNAFGMGGTNITSIPSLDSIYNATEWQLYNGSMSYKDLSNNWIDLPANAVTYSFKQLESSPIIPIISICFPKGTPVLCDQGEIAIEKIDSSKHTIRGKKIVAITKTITIEDKIVCIEKDSFANNIPNRKTFISRNHKIFFNKQMVKAKNLVGQVEGVYNKKYNGEILYNVLLETHNKMIVNNLIVETLDPSSIVAQLYNRGYSLEEKNNIIININSCANEYKKVLSKLK